MTTNLPSFVADFFIEKNKSELTFLKVLDNTPNYHNLINSVHSISFALELLNLPHLNLEQNNHQISTAVEKELKTLLANLQEMQNQDKEIKKNFDRYISTKNLLEVIKGLLFSYQVNPEIKLNLDIEKHSFVKGNSLSWYRLLENYLFIILMNGNHVKNIEISNENIGFSWDEFEMESDAFLKYPEINEVSLFYTNLNETSIKHEKKSIDFQLIKAEL